MTTPYVYRAIQITDDGECIVGPAYHALHCSPLRNKLSIRLFIAEELKKI